MKQVALEHGLPVLQPERMGTEELHHELQGYQGILVVVAFGQKLPDAILALPPLGCINVHSSLLPKYGAAPINAAILAGDTVTGVSTMYMDRAGILEISFSRSRRPSYLEIPLVPSTID